MIFGSTITGKLLDWQYRRIKARSDDSNTFTIEHARLRTMPIHLIVFCGVTVAWGWSLDKKASIAVPLVLQFIREFSADDIAVMC